MKLQKLAGTTSEIWQIFVADSSSTTGAGLTGLLFNTASLTAYYHRDTDTTATAITLVTMTVGTFTSSGFKEIDATNMPGWYQFCPPNAAIASGAKSCSFHLKGATNMAPLPIEVQLTAVNPDSSTAFVTGVNSLAPPTNWNLDSIDANGRRDVIKIAGTTQTARDLGASVLLSSGTGTGQVSLTSGTVDVGKWAGTSTALVGGLPSVNSTTHSTGSILTGSFAVGAIDNTVLATNAEQAIANVTLATAVDGAITLKQAQQISMAALAGILSGAATTTITIRDVNNTRNCIVATVDADGNRSAVTVSLV